MNETLKNVLGGVAVLATLSFSYAAYQSVQIYDRSSEPSNYRSFSVQAEGKVTATPDVATFSFSVITEGGSDVANLQSQNTQKMNQAIDYVKQEGVEKADISTSQYSIEPRYQNTICRYEEGKICPPAEIVGYTVRQSADVKIRNFELISSLLKGVVENGANSVSQIQFTIDDPTELENEARANAIAKAQEKAQDIAREAGFSIGRLLEINENFYGVPVYAKSMMMERSADYGIGGAMPAPTVEPGSQDVTISVNLRYEID